MANEINLNGMLYFEAVARLGQVAKAAAELGVSPSAVSQQLRSVEQQFGVKLFRRDRRRLILTMDGEQLYRAANLAFSTLRDARSAILRQREQRQLILRVSPSFGAIWLGPRLGRFLTRHDGWDMRIDATPDLSDFQTEMVDLDIRYGTGDWHGHYVEPVLHDHVVPLCSPAYLDELRQVSDDPLEQVMAARLIDNTKGVHRWDQWLADRGLALRPDAVRTGFDRSMMSIEMATQGVGISLDSVTLAYQALVSGALVPFAPQLGARSFPAYWLVCPPRHTNRRIVRLFFDWLRAEAELFDGEVEALMDRLGIESHAMTGEQAAPAPASGAG